MPVPDIDPAERDSAGITPTDAYHPTDRVWVYRHGAWRPGIVECCSARAATVTYCTGAGGGTGVDTLTASYVLPRADADPCVDREGAQARPAVPAMGGPVEMTVTRAVA